MADCCGMVLRWITKNDCFLEEILMQGNTMKDCIFPTAPYLRHLLKLDNLPQFCKHVSEIVLLKSGDRFNPVEKRTNCYFRQAGPKPLIHH